MKKIAITGGLGFIGFNLVSSLSTMYPGLSIIVIDNGISGTQNQFPLSSHIHPVNITISRTTVSLVAEALKDCELVVHLAALGNVADSIIDPISNFDANVDATLCLLEAMKIACVKAIIFSSTGGALMGNTPPPVDETSLPMPISPYGASKLACEGYIRAYAQCYKLKSIILRFGNVYGPYSSHKKGVINKAIQCSLTNSDFTVRGNGTSTRDYIHVDDIVQGITQACLYLQEQVLGYVDNFHLANGEEVSLNFLINQINQLSDKPLQISVVPEIAGEVKRNASLSLKAHNILGFQPIISFEDGIKRLYSWINSLT